MAVVSHDFVLISRVDVWFVDNIVGAFDLSQVNGNNSIVPSYGLASINHLLELLIYVVDEFLNFVTIVHVFDSVGLAVDSCFRRLNSSLYFLIIRVNNYNSFWNSNQFWGNSSLSRITSNRFSTKYSIIYRNCHSIARRIEIICFFYFNSYRFCSIVSGINICIKQSIVFGNRNSDIDFCFVTIKGDSRSIKCLITNSNSWYTCSTPSSLKLNLNVSSTSQIFYTTQSRIGSCLPQIKIRFIQLYTLDSVLSIGTLGPGVLPLILIVGIQRHPDNVTWLEVNRLAVVQLGGGFLNDVTIFVGYKQLAIELEVGRPVCFVIRASAILNSKSVSAHAQYHSRSQCYGKYFFHSLSSS